MAEVGWSSGAIDELEAIEAYLREFSPLAASRMGSRLVEAASALAHFPLRGRAIGGGRRELTQVSPYLIRYRAEADQVLVLEVRHGAREPEGS